MSSNHGASPRDRDGSESRASSPVTRRAFLKTATATGAAAALSAESLLATPPRAQRFDVQSGEGIAQTEATYRPLTREQMLQRRQASQAMREERARHWATLESPLPKANSDELLYPDGWANFSKSLPHDALGHPNAAAFKALVRACNSGLPADFDAIPLGGVQPLRNPQGGLCLDFCGYDSNQTIAPPAPAFASAWRAGEMVEVYWASLLRDVPFSTYATDPLVALACADLTALSDFRGPKEGGAVTPNTIFRGPYAGCEVGPFISQFLLKDIAFGAQINTQQVRVFAPGIDHMTDYAAWLARQNGAPFAPRVYDGTLRYMRTIRDLAAWVDADPPFQAAYHALSILLQMSAPIDPGNPYFNGAITNQDAFTTFGPVEWFDIIGRAPRAAHAAVWFQKWRVHRALRPEEYAGRVHNHLAGAFTYPLHADVLSSMAVAQTKSRHGTHLCAQAYPDGCPTHTSYPSGHSVGSGSSVTMLKAIFDESFVIPNPVEASPDGLSLVPYVGPPLTVGGELNKLAFNIGMARVMAGIHWRSDVFEGNKLGEAVSLSILEDMKAAYNEVFSGFGVTKFDGSVVNP